MDVLIIGNGMAAYSATSEILKNPDSDVTVVSEEKLSPYYRTRILELLNGGDEKSLLADTSTFPSDRYHLLSSVSALSIDRKAKSVKLSDGSIKNYDVLVLANGSVANRLSLTGSDADNIMTLRSISDVLNLKEKLSEIKGPLAVIGGGLLGLEAAYAISKAANRAVTVLEGFPYLLPRQLDSASSVFLQKLLEEKGLVFATGVKIASFVKEKGRVKAIKCEDGSLVDASLVVESVGVTPSINLAAEAGLSTSRGVLVDEHCRTSDESIYAVGDVAEYNGKVPGLMSVALDMGRTAGSVIAGKDALYSVSAPSVMLKVAGLDVLSYGYVNGEGAEKFSRSNENSLECCFVKEGVLVGAIAIGTREHASLFRSSIGKDFDNAFRAKVGL